MVFLILESICWTVDEIRSWGLQVESDIDPIVRIKPNNPEGQFADNLETDVHWWAPGNPKSVLQSISELAGFQN